MKGFLKARLIDARCFIVIFVIKTTDMTAENKAAHAPYRKFVHFYPMLFAIPYDVQAGLSKSLVAYRDAKSRIEALSSLAETTFFGKNLQQVVQRRDIHFFPQRLGFLDILIGKRCSCCGFHFP